MTIRSLAARPLVLLGALAPLALSACGSSGSASSDDAGKPTPAMNGGLMVVGSNTNTNTGVAVNAYLWRAALDTLSFMPTASADPFGGVIITDWYSPPGSQGDRFKATAYVLSRQLRSDAIRVTIFHQTLAGGAWVDAPVSPGTAGEMEDKILARARQLRSQTGVN